MAGLYLENLTALTAPAESDILYIVDDPGGTPLGKSITLAEIRKALDNEKYVLGTGGDAYLMFNGNVIFDFDTLNSGTVDLKFTYNDQGAEALRITQKGITLTPGTAANPSIVWQGNLTTGFYEAAGDQIGVSIAGSNLLTLAANTLTLADAANLALNTSTGTKIGTATSQKLAFYNSTPIIQPVANLDLGTVLSNLGLRASGLPPAGTVTAGITASTTQTQGQGALTSEINEVATVANANDTVTLPSAVAGLRITVINNGANTLQIFPASGDNAGAGVDTAVTLAAGSSNTFLAYDTTNWEVGTW